jgi:HK97 gp10 family phage protein
VSEQLLHVEGLAALESMLAQLPDKIERNIVRGALRAGSREFVKEAQRRVPRKTGRLAKSIRVSVRKVRGALVATTKAGNKEAFYAHLVEFGTAAHLIKPANAKALAVAGRAVAKVRHPGGRAQPFMRPAFDIGGQRAVLSYAAYMRKRLTKAGIDRLTED